MPAMNCRVSGNSSKFRCCGAKDSGSRLARERMLFEAIKRRNIETSDGWLRPLILAQPQTASRFPIHAEPVIGEPFCDRYSRLASAF